MAYAQEPDLARQMIIRVVVLQASYAGVTSVVPLVVDRADGRDIPEPEQALDHVFVGGVAGHALVLDLIILAQNAREVAGPRLGVGVGNVIGGRAAKDVYPLGIGDFALVHRRAPPLTVVADATELVRVGNGDEQGMGIELVDNQWRKGVVEHSVGGIEVKMACPLKT